jgi:3-oxoadipate enol-lactonase
MTPGSQRVAIADTSLYCETIGDGPPLLFVHGFPLSGELWRETAEHLADRWTCIVPDLRGHGRSPATPNMTIARYADDLAELLDALGETKPVVLVGLSMGGIIAFDFFRRHRARLRALILVCTRANAEPPDGVARREALAQAVQRDGSRAAADAMIDNLLSPDESPELKRRWHALMSATPPVGVAAAARALATREDFFPTLPRIDVPTLVVAGAQDAITPPEGLREVHERIPGSEFEIIANAGHLPPVERPEEFVRRLREFLIGLESRSA